MSSNGYITFGTGLATTSTPTSAATTWDRVVLSFGRAINPVSDIAG